MGSTDHHALLWKVCKELPGDYEPYGQASRDGGDCSWGCLHYYVLDARDGQPLQEDWGVCANPASHRCGLLTFEHQGCGAYEPGPEPEDSPG
jgi:hypothetical protein